MKTECWSVKATLDPGGLEFSKSLEFCDKWPTDLFNFVEWLGILKIPADNRIYYMDYYQRNNDRKEKEKKKTE